MAVQVAGAGQAWSSSRRAARVACGDFFTLILTSRAEVFQSKYSFPMAHVYVEQQRGGRDSRRRSFRFASPAVKSQSALNQGAYFWMNCIGCRAVDSTQIGALAGIGASPLYL